MKNTDKNVYYWILRLRLPGIFRLLKEKRNCVVKKVTYIEATKPALFLLKLLGAPGIAILRIPFRQIEARRRPSGPKLNLSSVRNHRGEVIIFDLYHQVLHLRRKASLLLMDSFKNLDFFKDTKSPEMITAYLGVKIAEEITAVVYMAHYARWKHHEKEPGENKNAKHILVIPASQWNATVVPNLEEQELVDEIRVDKKAGEKIKTLASVIKYLILATAKSGLLKPKTNNKKSSCRQEQIPAKAKVMVAYRMGLLEDKRNDMAFYHSSNIKPGRLLVYLKTGDHQPSEEESAWIRDNGVTCIAAPHIKIKSTGDGISQWHSTPRLKQQSKSFYLTYLKTAAQCLKKDKRNPWLLCQLWDLGLETAYWKDFFFANNVKILVNSIPSEENFIPNIAVSETGGLAVEMERSIRFDYCTYIHNSPNHIYFATGPYSLTQVPEPSFSRLTVQTGGINILRGAAAIDGVDKIKKQAGIVIAVFDELPSDWFFGDSIRQLYEAMVDLLKKDERFSLLIKTKKPQVLAEIETVGPEITRLSEGGRCVLAGWQITPAAAAAQADFAVCVPSTAAFESVMTGTPTVVYNPMRSGSSIFYRNKGLNRRIFEDSHNMITAIRKYADGKDDSIGDCSDILSFIDPFGDAKGAERMGQFLEWCLDGFDAGLEGEKTVTKAAEKYARQWGNDKITNTGDNAYGVSES